MAVRRCQHTNMFIDQKDLAVAAAAGASVAHSRTPHERRHLKLCNNITVVPGRSTSEVRKQGGNRSAAFWHIKQNRKDGSQWQHRTRV